MSRSRRSLIVTYINTGVTVLLAGWTIGAAVYGIANGWRPALIVFLFVLGALFASALVARIYALKWIRQSRSAGSGADSLR